MSRSTKISHSIDRSHDEISRIQQDISVLNQKISEFNGEPAFAATSGFVSGLRGTTDAERRFGDTKEAKLAALEKLFEKLAEFDRVILSKTVPPVDANAVPARRKSSGLDLHTFPTHLHITDRLMDLYNQSKRVTVIKTTVQGSNSNTGTVVDNSSDKQMIENLKTQLTRVTQLCDESEKTRKRQEQEIEQLQKELTEQNKQTKVILAQSPIQNVQSKEPVVAIDETVALRARIKELEGLMAQLHDRLEVELGKYSSVLNVVFGKATRIGGSGKDLTVEESAAINDCFNLPDDMRGAFQSLEVAVATRMHGLRAEVSMLLGVKELLEGEVSSVSLQRDLLNADHVTLSSEHEALKAAYHELSCETAAAEVRRNRERAQESARDTDLSLQGQLTDASATIHDLQQQLYDNARKIADFDRLSLSVTELEQRLRVVTEERISAGTTILGLNEEIAQYQKLTETLKDKIRQLGTSKGGASGGDATKEFLDTFEEVMREEMLTMKTAFENKLRVAREEAEKTSKRHQQEIMRLHTASPYTAGLKR